MKSNSPTPSNSGYITGDHNGDTSKAKVSELLWAFEATLAVMVSEDPSRSAMYPSLVVGMSFLGRPGVQPAAHAINALKSITGRGLPIRDLIVDNLYPKQDSEKFQLPATDLGYRLIFEYTSTQYGIMAEAHGAFQVEGKWYCPAMPEPLISASADLAAKKITHETWQIRISARRQYELRPNGTKGADGSQRFLCPASGAGATLKCAQKPQSLQIRSANQTVSVPAELEKHPPKICRQTTVTIDRTTGAKLAQDLAYGSPEWTQRYRNSRSSNEGFNGLAKKTAPVDISDPNLRRIRGVAAQSILIAFQLAAVNLRRIDSCLKEHLADPDFEKKDARRDKRRAKSRPFSPRESARGKSPPPGVVVPS